MQYIVYSFNLETYAAVVCVGGFFGKLAGEGVIIEILTGKAFGAYGSSFENFLRERIRSVTLRCMTMPANGINSPLSGLYAFTLSQKAASAIDHSSSFFVTCFPEARDAHVSM
jgi:hypothetical protein